MAATDRRRSVLVTGASSGIGHACVQRLARSGWRVFATVRSREDAENITNSIAGDLVPLLLDVRDAQQIEAAAIRIDEVTGDSGLDGLVNNAGIAVAGPLEFLPIDALRLQLEVNVIGQVAVTQAMLPALRRANGRIVFIGSIAGRSAMPLTGAYSASKFAIEAMSDALRVELRDSGLWSCVIEPGTFGTSIWDTSLDRANRMLEAMPDRLHEYYGGMMQAVRNIATRSKHATTPEPVATAVEHALTTRRPRARYTVGRGTRFRIFLEMLPTRLRDGLVANRLKALSASRKE